MTKQTSNGAMKWVGGVSASLVVLLLSWIGYSVTSIPVMQNDIAQIKDNIAAQVMVNVKRLDDHEGRLRELERK